MNDSNEEKSTISFYCKNCDIIFEIEDQTPLDDIKCPKCGTDKLFIEYEVDDNKVKL